MNDADLLAYLDEQLPAGEMARLEQALRGDEALRARLARLLRERDAGLHSLAAIWRRGRISCATRSQLGSYLLGVLPTAEAEFLRLHLEVTGCRYCLANLDDLQSQRSAAATPATESRRRRYFQSSVGRLKAT
ncbi:MAG: hypothetical protein JSS27_15240 [Planctomycetes bacterium]|nr:hypothetical protein [Planctomycetota bacterium]